MTRGEDWGPVVVTLYVTRYLNALIPWSVTFYCNLLICCRQHINVGVGLTIWLLKLKQK